MTAADFETMTLGMVIDYLIVCNNEEIESKRNKNKEPVRYATQADIDAW